MAVDREKTVRLLKEAILQLCRVSLMGSFEVDGIICISPSNSEEEHELVIKVHEQVSEESVDGMDKRKQDIRRNRMFALKCSNDHEDSMETTNETVSTWKNSGSDANSWMSSDFAGCVSGNNWKQTDRMPRIQPGGSQHLHVPAHNHEDIQELSIKRTVRKIEDSFYFACKLCAVAFTSKFALDSHVERCSQRNLRNELGDPVQLEEGIQQRIARKRKQRKPLKGFDDVVYSDNLSEMIAVSDCQLNNDSIPKIECQSDAIPPDDELSTVTTGTLNPTTNDLFQSPSNEMGSPIQHSFGPTHIKSDQMYSCQVCSTDFSDLTTCVYHHKTVHNIYVCSYCQEKFSDERNLMEHLAVHTGTESYACLLCGLELKSRSDLVAHHQQVHGLMTEGSDASNNGDLKEESKSDDVTSDEEVMFKQVDDFVRCEAANVCANGSHESENQSSQNKATRGTDCIAFASKQFVGNSELSPKFLGSFDCGDRMSFNDDEKVYECDKCRELVRGTDVYQMHCKRFHRRTPCLHCGKTFSQKGNMERHMRLHTGVKPFRCHLCRRSFCRKEVLLGHINQDHNATVRSTQ